jgi:hypothetical protein
MPAVGQGDSRKIAEVEVGGSGRDEFVKEAREQLAQDLGATSQQEMKVPALRKPAPVNGVVGQHIWFHHGDRVIELGQHPRSQQTAR